MRIRNFRAAGHAGRWVAGMLVGILAPLAAPAQTKSCDAASLNGSYGYRLSGYVYDAQGYTYYLGSVGRLASDGAGAITGTQTLSFDGTVVKQQYTGTYTVNADCTGSLTMTPGNAGALHFDFVIVNNGVEVELVQTDPAFIQTGTMKQQNPAQSQAPAQPPAQP